MCSFLVSTSRTAGRRTRARASIARGFRFRSAIGRSRNGRLAFATAAGIAGAAMRRREFLLGSGGLAAARLLPAWAQSPATSQARGFSFLLLGDLHYDKLEHHDLAWLDQTHPNDL